MKIHNERRAVTTENLTEENEARNFTIKADAAMFKMLSSTLYTHKIRAVIRELTCNAWDAHQAAKRQDTPIKVHLPTHMEPFFEVKDFGKGLSQESVMKLFSTYGESTKQGSNKEIGGFGIGSKSPFCYVDSFLVESRHGGVKSTYNAYIEKTGAPSIVFMGSTPMEPDDLTGITVKMTAESKDCAEFEREAAQVLRFFAAPVVDLNSTILTVLPAPLYENVLGRVYKDYSNKGLYALMGNVLYPIPASAIPYTAHSQILTSNKYIVYFKIGELEVAPSREQLSLTPDTIKTLKKKTEAFIEFFFIERNKALSVHRYPWEFVEALGKTLDIFSGRSCYFKKNTTQIFQEHSALTEIKHRLNALTGQYIHAPIVKEIDRNMGTKDPLFRRLIRAPKYPYAVETDKVKWLQPRSNCLEVTTTARVVKQTNPLPKILILHGSKEKLDSTSVKYEYFLKKNGREGTAVFCVKLPYVDSLYLKAFKRRMLHLPAACYAWFKDLPMPTREELLAAGMEVPDDADKATSPVKESVKAKHKVYEVRARINRTVASLYTGTHNTVTSPSDLPEYKKLKDGEVLYYTHFEDFYIPAAGAEQTGFRHLVEEWQGRKDRPIIYGLSKTHCKKVQDDPKWRPAEELFKEYFKTILQDRLYYTPSWLKNKEGFRSYGQTGGRYSQQVTYNFVTKNKDFTRYMEIVERLSKKNSRYVETDAVEGIVACAKAFGVTIPQSSIDKLEKNGQDDDKFLADFFAKYPMFKVPAQATAEGNQLYEDYITTITMLSSQQQRKRK